MTHAEIIHFQGGEGGQPPSSAVCRPSIFSNNYGSAAAFSSQQPTRMHHENHGDDLSRITRG